MNKHTTDKGVSNSLRGFFERIVKPYTTRSIDAAKEDQNIRYPMTFEKFAGNIAVYKTFIPTKAYTYGSNSNDYWYGYRGFTVNRNNTEIFTSKLNKQTYDNSFVNSASSKYISLGLVQRALTDDSSKLIDLAPLNECAFPFEPQNFAVYWVNPSYDYDTPNVFYVPEYDRDTGNESDTYNGIIQTIGFIKANSGYDIGNLSGFGYYSKIETRKEKCCFYKIDTSVPEARELKVNINVLEISEVKQKLIEVFETTEEELDSKIQTIRIMDAISVNGTTCILISVNNTKLMAICYKKEGTSTVSNIAKIEVFDIGSDINFSKLTRKIYEEITYKDKDEKRSTKWVREYIESAITTSDGRIFRFICDPDYVLLNRVEGDTSGSDWYNYHYSVTREPELLLEEAEVGDFTKNNTIIGIIDNSTTYYVGNYDNMAPMSNYNTTRIATLNGMIVFEDAAKKVSGEIKANKIVTTVADITETRSPLVTRIIKDDTFKDYRLTGYPITGYPYYLKNSKNVILRFGEKGYLAIMGDPIDAQILYSPDGVSWFLTIGNKDYNSSYYFGARYVYHYDSYDKRLNYGQVVRNANNYFRAGIYSNRFYISDDNVSFKPVLFNEHITTGAQKNYDIPYDENTSTTKKVLAGTEVIYLSADDRYTITLPTVKIVY